MDHVLSYNFDEIEYTVRQEIHSTSARLNAALDDLRAQIAPLQEIWTREAAVAYRPARSTRSCSVWVTPCAMARKTLRPPIAAPRTHGAHSRQRLCAVP